jgi:hypothetical protein
LDGEQQQAILQSWAQNLEQWTLARQLQSNKVNINDMYDVISRISWDRMLLKEAMKNNANGMFFFITDNKSARKAMKQYPKRKTRTSLRAWRNTDLA